MTTVILRNISFTTLPGCDPAALASPSRFAGVVPLPCGARYTDEDFNEYAVCSSAAPGACAAQPVSGTTLTGINCTCPSPQFPNEAAIADTALAPYLPFPTLDIHFVFEISSRGFAPTS
jgi:hypothetical protein|eukprot:7380044-Prymnesium_polylepis.1